MILIVPEEPWCSVGKTRDCEVNRSILIYWGRKCHLTCQRVRIPEQTALPLPAWLILVRWWSNGKRRDDNKRERGQMRWRGKQLERQSFFLSLGSSLYAPAPWQLFKWLKAHILYLVSPHSFTHSLSSLQPFHNCNQEEWALYILLLRLHLVSQKHWSRGRVLHFYQCLLLLPLLCQSCIGEYILIRFPQWLQWTCIASARRNISMTLTWLLLKVCLCCFAVQKCCIGINSLLEPQSDTLWKIL